MMNNAEKKTMEKDYNRDPITGEPGSHPVGTGVGAAVGAFAGVTGAAAAGAAMGSAVGPLGTIAGAAIGGLAGGFAGKGIAEAIDPTAEEAYWEENYKTRPYIDSNADYDTYRPAYRYGVDAGTRYSGKSFDEIQPDLQAGWNQARGQSQLGWDKAQNASRDAYERIGQRQAMREPTLRPDAMNQ